MTEIVERKPTILVVDDSRLMRVAARKILRNDFEILEAGDGEQAWAELHGSSHIDLIMSDLSMPNLDGLGLLKRIRETAEPDLKTLPVIIVTGAEDDDGSKQTALAAGASDFITKPFESVQLLARAKAQAKQQQTQKALQSSEADKQKLEQHSSVDVLTGLANERDFVSRIEADLSYARRHSGELSLLLVQVERYKILFLRRGKQAAEGALRRIAQLLSNNRRREDQVARIGLDTFGVLLPSADADGGTRVAENLLEAIRGHDFSVDGQSVSLTASIAVVSPASAEATPLALLDEAKRKLQLAVTAGGDRIQRELPAEAPVGPTPAEGDYDVIGLERTVQALVDTGRPQDAAALARTIMPVLRNWNQACNDRHRDLLEALENALAEDHRAALILPADAV